MKALGRAEILLRPDLGKPHLGPLATSIVAKQVIAHEMGHVIGFLHEPRGCTIMAPRFGPKGPPGCRAPKEAWRIRCRLLEHDDVAGVVKLYGGHIRAATDSPFCPVAPAPAAPAGVRVTETADREGALAEIAWTNPPSPKDGPVLVTRRAGTCPRGPNDPQARKVGMELKAGRAQTLTDSGQGLTHGRWCYLVEVYTYLGQPGKVATAILDYEGRPPVADFREMSADGDPNTVIFEDRSSDADGQVVAWSWNGDGATSPERSPTHHYAGPGAYAVTLTVTDDSGKTAATSGQVEIDARRAEGCTGTGD